MAAYNGVSDRTRMTLSKLRQTTNNKNGRRSFLSWIILFSTLTISSISVLADENIEYPVKAGFIFNFIVFTEWPETTVEAINLCIYGEDYFGNSIDALQNKTSRDKQIRVIRLDSEFELEQCQVVFISRNVIGNLSNILDRLKDGPVLTLADSPNAASQGVMINMKMKNEQIIFEINLAAILKSGLRISSKVLQLAKKVYQ